MASSAPDATSRNRECPCGSGRRFKHCCGANSAAPSALELGIAAHGRGQLGPAEARYREALAQDPADLRARHLLGGLLRQRLRHHDALETLWETAEGTGWRFPEVREELGLVLARLLALEADARRAALRTDARTLAAERARASAARCEMPLVSVVAPGDADTLASVRAQTWPALEIVETDAGASLAAGFNAGAARARGRYVAFLECGATFAPERIARLVERVARAGARWGYSLVAGPGAEGDDAVDAVHASDSFAFADRSANIASGNLFVERDWFLALGGLPADAADPAREFGLRAGALDEPVAIREPLYRGAPRAPGSGRRPIPAAILQAGLDGTLACTNPLSPFWPGNRALLLRDLCAARQGAAVPVAIVRELAQRLREAPAPTPAEVVGAAGTAMVVLGMHRSGTSAFARVLNLCGAFLPERLIAADAERNPRGYWEAVDVVALNERALEQLGGAWDRPDAVGDADAAYARAFVREVALLLASEYGGHHDVLIKDPRMGALAPLWDRALRACGYRTAYVVPVRHPLEVARSLQARDGIGVRAGLGLWLAYMRRIVAFADAGAEVAFVAYTDLLDDWRGVLARIEDRLDLRLDPRTRAAEVDAFLDPAMRRQRADSDVLGLFDDAELHEIETLHRALLARCLRPPAREARVEAGAASASFVLCIEDNGIREQALLLCESIRRFGGAHRHAPILAFSPRPALRVGAATVVALERLGVRWIDEPLNTRCAEYGSANRVFAAAWAERQVDSDFIVVLDSDTVFLDAPELPLGADAALRPVDSKGSASAGPHDPLDAYWGALADLAGVPLDELPWIRSTIGGERIRASYNGGLIVARRECGLLSRWAELFARSIDADLRPLRGSGQDIYASTGHVGRAASEWWGSNQAALALTLCAAGARVRHYSARYNVPLHLVAANGAIDPAWSAQPPVHVHYHWMFDAAHRDAALGLLAELGVAGERIAWLARRTPLRGAPE